LIARVLRAIGWAALFCFAAGAGTYVVAALLTQLYGPVFYAMTLTSHLGFTILYGLGGLVILGAALLIGYAIFLHGRPVLQSMAALAAVAFAAQVLELCAIEAFAIREPQSLTWPIAEQLMPFNIGLFRPVGIWEGRPDAAFFWFSAALVALVCAWWNRKR
jgi:hypothetical protein